MSKFLKLPSNLDKISFLLVLFCSYSQGGSTFSLANGKNGYCLPAVDCPEKAVYSSGDCSCDKNLQEVCCLSSGISEKKCQEYGQYVYTQDYGAALTSRRTLSNVSQCHIESVPLIVGGVKAASMEFPHMTAIGYGDASKITYMCGGSLISEQFVLSAAHCCNSRDHGPAKWAKLGALELLNKDEAVQDFAIIQTIMHPSYKTPSRYNDIAIFKLEKPVELNGYVRPACLQHIPDLPITNATASGWGKLQYTDTTGSPELMKVQLNVIDGTPCEDTYKKDKGGLSMTKGIIKSQLCAGEMAGGKDTCQGDSGGPLQVTLAKPYCMYAIHGITSFGKFCGFSNAPAIYSRVSYFVPWIESVVWP